MRNPLGKRVPKELKSEWRKYLVIFLFLAIIIGFVSGIYVANDSMLKSYEETKDTLKREDGHFELNRKATDTLKEKIEDEDIKIYENFYKDTDEDSGKKDCGIRVFTIPDKINLADVLKGELPDSDDEIAIDRMHAANSNIKVGDVIGVNGKDYTVTGLISFTNYTTLFESNTDLMFDAITFDVGIVTEEVFDNIDASIHYSYAWVYDETPKDKNEEKEVSDELLKDIAVYAMEEGNTLMDFVPEYLNQAIQFAPNDMGSDKNMAGILLYILVIVLAFIFAVTTSSTIEKEATVIGTLRASGYTRGELLRHYMMMPLIVTLFAALAGNVLGYTVFKNIAVSMYYNSYSLPSYKTVLNSEAFIKTTIIPIILMVIINLVIVSNKLRMPILKFMRHDFSKTKKSNAMRIPSISFMGRFRIRIMLQNLYNYLVLILGLSFVMIMVVFTVGMPESISAYKNQVIDEMFVNNQYYLKSYVDNMGNVIKTDNKDAEKYCQTSLETIDGVNVGESVVVYGVVNDSKYLDVAKNLKKGHVSVSSGYANKFRLKEGDKITLKEKYADDEYDFTVDSIMDYTGSIAIFMPIESFNSIFDKSEDYFSGYFSDTEITDIPNEYIVTDITIKDMTKMSNQLEHSIGGYMTYFTYMCGIMAAILIYLITKVIIEKNETSISMIKILGFRNGEIGSLYIIATTLVVVIAELIGMVVSFGVVNAVWRAYLNGMDGWAEFTIYPLSFVKIFFIVFVGYILVTVVDMHRIKKVPMDEALKNVE